ncbi:MAG: hypothetical protein ABI051_09520 [Vicinamibacterales bacterium]
MGGRRRGFRAWRRAWSKLEDEERERFDGADVLHLILIAGRSFDWRHLCSRFSGHEGLLLTYLFLFGYVYPGEMDTSLDG